METMMSDDTNAAFNGFKLSFPTLINHYLCQWHIQQRWMRATKGATAGSKSGKMGKSTQGMASGAVVPAPRSNAMTWKDTLGRASPSLFLLLGFL